MGLRREYLAWIPHCDPPDGNYGVGREDSVDVNYAVDTDFGPASDSGSGKYRGARCDERALPYLSPVHMAERTDQDVVGDSGTMFGATPNERLFHDDAIPTDIDRTSVLGYHRAKQYSRTFSH